MQPLNPFLAAFSKSSLVSQCSPARLHILLVPTTEVLLDSRDTETGAPLVDSIATDEFLGSHILRIPATKGSVAGGKDGKDVPQNLREMRGKAKVYSTINGRSVVIKDNIVYSNKGFRSLAHANILHDTIWYPDTLEPKALLIYFIARPLVGSWDEVKVVPAVISSQPLKPLLNGSSPSNSHDSTFVPKKKDIRSFQDVLDNFPAIARQMDPGLAKLFHEFTMAFERPLPPPPSANDIPDPIPDGPITSAVKRARSNSAGAASNHRPNGFHMDNFFTEDDEDVMKISLETAVTSAIDLFQGVDKQQLSILGATTDLTGPICERLIERYVTENVHHLLFPRLCAFKRPDDLELEAKIRQMEFIDISQLGIAIEGGPKGKRDMIWRLGRAVEEFRKMTLASCPQQMMDTLLSTMKAATMISDTPSPSPGKKSSSEKPIMTINADTLVSLLLYVVIRAQIKHLQARLSYIHQFIFIDDVESGEMGYALSTFEAVLSYLDHDSGGLRRASRRNKALWDAVAKGDMTVLRDIMEPAENAEEAEYTASSRPSTRRLSSTGWSFANGYSRRSSSVFTPSDRFSQGSGLSHVFPFQNGANDFDEDLSSSPLKKIKRVSMDTRSMSSGSEISFRSRTASIGTWTSGIEGDTSIERLSQTQDSSGESVLMMAIQNERMDVLQYLLSLKQHYPPEFVLDDCNNDGTTLLSAAIQLGHVGLINTVLDCLFDSVSDSKITQYLALQDVWGRSAAHYLFHAPFLIQHIGRLLPWRQRDKNGQTPLFALCRSYDHSVYLQMVEQGLEVATKSQGDGQALHLDDHVDAKGNTLLHIVTDARLAMRILRYCDADVNATNEKRFTPLMVASKYGRLDMVSVLYADPRVDAAAKEYRGLSAVELAKDDYVRNEIDNLALRIMSPGPDSRTTGVVRSYFVEDASIRFVVKSGVPPWHEADITTCRRSLTDFERLLKALELEHPASWVPSLENLRSPTQIPSKPSRAMLKDLQLKMNWFLRILLNHATFATHEMLWEFFLVPELQLDAMEQRSKLKADARIEKVRDELEPVEDLREIEQFVDHARDMVRSVHFSIRSVARRSNVVGNVAWDLHESSQLLSRAIGMLAFMPLTHIDAFDTYVCSLMPAQNYPSVIFFNTFLTLYGSVETILKALARPPQLISRIIAMRREVERNYSSLNRSSRWPLGLLDDTRQRMNDEREEKARRNQQEAENLGKELRYTQNTVAAELAGWREMHEKLGRKAIKDLAKGMLIRERMHLHGLQRALRKIRSTTPPVSTVPEYRDPTLSGSAVTDDPPTAGGSQPVIGSPGERASDVAQSQPDPLR